MKRDQYTWKETHKHEQRPKNKTKENTLRDRYTFSMSTCQKRPINMKRAQKIRGKRTPCATETLSAHRHYLDLKYVDMPEETNIQEKRPIYMKKYQ